MDENGITPKMFRRHFKYLINIFPGLSIQTQQVDGCEDNSNAPEPLTPASEVTENKSECRFTGPFSIDSLLKSDREVKRARSTCPEEHAHYIDAQRGATKSKHVYEYEAEKCYYPVPAVGCELASAERPRLSSGPQFGQFLPSHITYNHHVLFSSPSMYDTRYVSWWTPRMTTRKYEEIELLFLFLLFFFYKTICFTLLVYLILS